MADHVTLSSKQRSEHVSIGDMAAGNQTDSKVNLRASMSLALESFSSGTDLSYSADSLVERQEFIEQRRRDSQRRELELEDDILAEDEDIDRELTAGAHLDELQTVLEDIAEERIVVDQDVIDDMTMLMVELRDLMPSLPEHIVAEIKDVARPLRSIVQNFNNRVVVQ